MTMKFAYEDLSPTQFEELAVHICRKIMGVSVIGFSTGPDGGRDARFNGTAELHPSKASPWVGKVIIQGKHTNGMNKSCSDRDFHSKGSKNSTLAREMPRVKKLHKDGDLDHYMLITNRRLSGIADAEIRKYIANEVGIPEDSVFIYGLEQIDSLLRSHPDIATALRLDLYEAPLIVSPDQLSIVVEAVASILPSAVQSLESLPVHRTSYAEKNTLNNMSAQYAAAMRKRYLKDTQQIRAFLADADNDTMRKHYDDATADFQLKIIAKKESGQSFDVVMEYLFDLLVSRDAVLAANRRITRAMLFYMYWNCDIGEVTDAPSV